MSQLIRYGAHALAGFLPVPGSRTALSYRSKGGASPLDADTTLFYDFAGTEDLIDEINGLALTFTRASSAWYYNAMGLLVEAANDAPRFDHDQSIKVSLGLLIEEARTNLCLWSRNGAQTAWDKTNMDAVQNQVGITGGGATATLLTATAPNATILQTVTGAATNRAFSVSLKRVTGTGQIDISGDALGGNLPITLTTEWERFFVTANIIDPVFGIRLGTSGDEVAMDVAQLEVGIMPSSPIITAATTVTRAADDCQTSDLSWMEPTGLGTFFCRFSQPYFDTASNNKMFGLRLGAAGSDWTHQARNATGSLRADYGSATPGLILGGSFLAGVPTKSASALDTNDFVFYVSGVQAGTDSNVALDNTPISFQVGRASNTNFWWNGHIQELGYANVRKDNEYLQDITQP